MHAPRVFAAAVAAAALVPAAALAQGFPSKPIRIVVPYQAGGTSEMMARQVADQLQQALKQMTDLQLIDWRADAGAKVLKVWNWGTQLANSGVTLAAGTNLLELNIGSEVV